MCGKIMTVFLIFVALNCSMARYSGRLHCIVGVLPTCYKRKAATYFYLAGGTGQGIEGFHRKYVQIKLQTTFLFFDGCTINILKQELSGTKAYKQTSEKEKSVINNPFFHNATRFAVSVKVVISGNYKNLNKITKI